MIKKLKIVFVACFFLPVAMFSQMDIGIFAGLSGYQGELSAENTKAFFKQSHADFGVKLGYGIGRWVNLNAAFNYGKLSGDDSFADTPSRVDRNLSFKSTILEGTLVAHFNVLGFQPYNLISTFSPYVFAGVGGVYHNPKAYYENAWTELRPLGTEGQGSSLSDLKQYKKIELVIPLGIGVKYAITDKFYVGFEVGPRITFTDYLDDVSGLYVDPILLGAENGETAAQLSDRYIGTDLVVRTGEKRGDSTKNDWYWVAGFNISYVFSDNGLVGSRKRNSKRSGCNY